MAQVVNGIDVDQIRDTVRDNQARPGPRQRDLEGDNDMERRQLRADTDSGVHYGGGRAG